MDIYMIIWLIAVFGWIFSFVKLLICLKNKNIENITRWNVIQLILVVIINLMDICHRMVAK